MGHKKAMQIEFEVIGYAIIEMKVGFLSISIFWYPPKHLCDPEYLRIILHKLHNMITKWNQGKTVTSVILVRTYMSINGKLIFL